MRICAYVPGTHAKQNYANECFDARQYAGLLVVVDILRRAGYEVNFAGKATVSKYDVVLVSITSDCDWWPYIAERVQWPKGNYKVIVGGPGVLNVRPVIPYADYFVLGRAEGIIDKLVAALDGGSFESDSVIEASSFNPNKRYYINQTDRLYPHEVTLGGGQVYREGSLGCNHKCLFCGYTWHRKHIGGGAFEYGDLWSKNKHVEVALLDVAKGREVDYNKLRTTAIDGMSQRLRFAVNKKITREMLREFIVNLHAKSKPHQVKLYNILGYPGETEEDRQELAEDIRLADELAPKKDKQTCLLLHSTPFRPMPATPMACKPMSYRNYRGEVARVLGRGYKGNIFYQGRALWAVESKGTESLPTVIKSAIMLRGTEADIDNVTKIACSKRFETASAAAKQATLEKYFDIDRLFGAYSQETLPTSYLRTYADVSKMW